MLTHSLPGGTLSLGGAERSRSSTAMAAPTWGSSTGATRSAKRVAIVDGKRFVLLDVAFRFTRVVLAQLLGDRRLHDPKEIDARLLLGAGAPEPHKSPDDA